MSVNIKAAREAYATIMATLRKERKMRDTVLREPRRSAAIEEIDAAVVALETLGKVVWLAVDAGLLTADPPTSTQAPLLDIPETKYP